MSPVAEYDVFQYKHFDEPVLSLDEATKKAAELRQSDSQHVYRVVASDPTLSGFIIEKLSLQEAYGDALARIMGHMYRWFFLRPSRMR